MVGQQAEKLDLSQLEAVGVVRGAQAARRFLTEQCEQQTRANQFTSSGGPPVFVQFSNRPIFSFLTIGPATFAESLRG